MNDLDEEQIKAFESIFNDDDEKIDDDACDRCYGQGMTSYDAYMGTDCHQCLGTGRFLYPADDKE